MPRRKSVPEPPAPPPSTLKPKLRRWALQAALVLVLAGLALGGILWLSALARQGIQEHERFQIPFTDIECNPPPGMDRTDFLLEVQYESGLPDRFSVLREGMADDLRLGFARHAWVARVDQVELTAPRTARVTLIYREAVLAVAVAADLAGKGNGASASLRGVDRHGVLMPRKAPLAPGLPVLTGAPRPRGAAGQSWGDAVVLAAASAAVVLAPHWEKLQLKTMNWTAETLVLEAAACRALWGRDAVEEASAAEKLQRLLDIMDRDPPQPQPGTIEEIDLRPQTTPTRRRISRR